MDQKKSNKIREIVRLQQILKKWRRIANSSKTTTTSTTTTNNITSSKSMKFLKRTLSLSEREGSTTITSSNNGSVPKVNVFESILKMVEDGKKNDKFSNQECRSLSIEEMMGFCSLENQLACSHHPQSPLCR
ncbi:hypothetical protein P8452_06450 [Trifolium repens]|nr:hypothetical protein P8452_06450 [Trifolium repens]